MKHVDVQNRFVALSYLIIVLILLGSCTGNKVKDLKKQGLLTGESYLAVPGGTIWYKVTGKAIGIPLVLLHGGPGAGSYYLKAFEQLGNERQVIRYDQLGAGKSGKTADTALFTISHFVRELDSLRAHLGIDKWHVFGHSWGTILALEYYHAYPDHVVSLTFAGACFNMPAYEKHARQLISTLPDSSQKIINKADVTGKYEDPAYLKAMSQFYSIYGYRKPILADLDSLFMTMNERIYLHMEGNSEFKINGTLKQYDATALLSQIKVPTMFTAGEFDEAGPEIIKDFAIKVTNSRYILFKGAAHISMWDAKDESITAEREFLNEVASFVRK